MMFITFLCEKLSNVRR